MIKVAKLGLFNLKLKAKSFKSIYEPNKGF